MRWALLCGCVACVSTIDRDEAIAECGADPAQTSQVQRGLTLDGEGGLQGIVSVVEASDNGLNFWTCVPGFGGGRRLMFSAFSRFAVGEEPVSAHRYIDDILGIDELLEVASVEASYDNLVLPTEDAPIGSFTATIFVPERAGSEFDLDLAVSWGDVP